ncbi:MAG: hypothetical protein K0S82_1791 [Gaiellaceae bacterium]|jgi:hypothetical protein|nr:hypothetical protein [Gaiellaceae bacterium]
MKKLFLVLIVVSFALSVFATTASATWQDPGGGSGQYCNYWDPFAGQWVWTRC